MVSLKRLTSHAFFRRADDSGTLEVWERPRCFVAGHGTAFAGGRNRPALRLLLLHDDKAREFDDVAGAETSLELA